MKGMLDALLGLERTIKQKNDMVAKDKENRDELIKTSMGKATLKNFFKTLRMINYMSVLLIYSISI